MLYRKNIILLKIWLKAIKILTAIKFLVEEDSFRYVLSGSLLGVELRNSH